jgi:hypothetical protein
MRTARVVTLAVAVVLLVCGGARGQAAERTVAAARLVAARPLPSRVFPCRELARFGPDGAPLPVDVIARFADVLRRLPEPDGLLPPPKLTISETNHGPLLFACGSPEQLDGIAEALAAVRGDAACGVRLQCSVATMPMTVAAAYGVAPGRTFTGDAAQWAGVLREAVKAGGRVHNLPEATVDALEPFVRELPAAPRAANALRVRGHALPLGGGQVAVAVTLEHPAPPEGERRAPGAGAVPSATPPAVVAIAQPVFRLAAGRAAMTVVADRGEIVAVIVHCVETGVAVAK